MSNNYIVFNINTGVNPLAFQFLPEFDPDEVKHGNTKDPVLRAQKTAIAASQHEQEFKKSGALNAITLEILCISYKYSDGDLVTDFGNEKEILVKFWDRVQKAYLSNMKIVGHNHKDFDFPRIIRRSWINRIAPFNVMNGRYFENYIVDIRDLWQLYNRYDSEKSNLDILCKVFNLPIKKFQSKDFSKVWEKDRASAIEFSEQEVCRIEDLYKIFTSTREMTQVGGNYELDF